MSKDRIAELERIVKSQRAMLDEIAAAAGFKLSDTYSAQSLIHGIRAQERIELAHLGPRQSAVLAFIREEIAGGYGFPSHAAIAHALQWSDEGRVHEVLESLEYRGKVKRNVTLKRELNKSGKMVTKRHTKWELVR